jgi:hypothetical protein
MAASQKAIATSLNIFPVLKWITVNATPKFLTVVLVVFKWFV